MTSPDPDLKSSQRPSEALEPVLSAAAMRQADAFTIDDYGIPGFTLMELAGRAAIAACIDRFGDLTRKRIAILCGKGNNGGDGLVMARGFAASGSNVSVVLLAQEGLSDDAAHNLQVLGKLQDHLPEGRLEIIPFEASVPEADLYIDALLGTGLSVAVREPIDRIISWLNRQPKPVVAVDIPTGLHSDTGRPLGAAVRADLTVTMGACKTGLLINDGPDYAGSIVVAEIGIPRHALVSRTREASCAVRTTDAFVQRLLPKRPASAHKYSVGMTLAIAGSPGLTGAPIMASTAAARVGAGAVVCATHEAVQSVLAGRFTEVMTLGLPDDGSGGILTEEAKAVLRPRLEQAASLLVGCGLGRSEATAAFVRDFCTESTLPLVVDADGLNAFVGHADLISRHASGRWVLTPHEGEFRRLAGEVDLDDRVEAVRKWSATWQSVLVLKGMPSLVGAPDGRVFICGTGNPALATAGTGDVLAGMIAGLLAQGMAPEEAAACAVHLGGACADEYVKTRSARSMQATDLIENLPHVLSERFESNG